MLDEIFEIHPAATVFLISEEKTPRVLLLKHKKLGVWLPPGGHQEVNEATNTTALREVLEETGIDISNYFPSSKKLKDGAIILPTPSYILLEPIPKFDNTSKHLHQDLIYVIRIPYKKAIRKETESDEIGWFTIKQIKTMETFENVRYLLSDIFGDGLDKPQE